MKKNAPVLLALFTFINRAQFVKFLDLTKKPLIRFNFAINFPILRYADVLLMKAEAILRVVRDVPKPRLMHG